jgi:hypothetical protein
LFDSIINNFSKSTASKNQIQTLEGDKELLQPKANQSVRHEFVDAVSEIVEIEEDENFKIKRFQGDYELRDKAYNTTIMELKVQLTNSQLQYAIYFYFIHERINDVAQAAN